MNAVKEEVKEAGYKLQVNVSLCNSLYFMLSLLL